MKQSFILPLLAAVCLLSTPGFAQQEEDDSRKFNFGARLDYLPLKNFKTETTTASTTKPIADYTYTGSTSSPKFAFGPVFEMRLFRHISVGVELSYHRANYGQVTQIRTGKKDPNAATDNRQLTTITDSSRVNYWDVPLLFRYHRNKKTGLLKRFYPEAGVTYRHIGKIRTGNQIQNADGTTDYNEVPDVPAKKNQFGFTAGIGYRLVDEIGVKLIPEIRFTKWMGHGIVGPSYSSAPYQGQVGIGITF